MTTAYTSSLGLALPVQGELSGAWGNVVNNYITTYLDSAVAGSNAISLTADKTLTKQTGASLTGDSSQYAILNVTPNASTWTITVPAASQTYVINNLSATHTFGFKASGGTSITIAASEKTIVAWNGSNFVRIGGAGGPGIFSSITNSSLTSGRVVYSTTGGLEVDSANLTFNGTNLVTPTLNGVVAGAGAGSVATNTAFGISALASNITGSTNTAIGWNALTTADNTDNTAVGHRSQEATTGYSNTSIGSSSLRNNTTGLFNVAVGAFALSTATGTGNVGVGVSAFNSGSGVSGNYNTAIGHLSGSSMLSGSYNTIIGGYTGSLGSFNITTSSNYIVLSDGAANSRAVYNATGVGFYTQASPTSKSTTATLTGAEVLTQILNTTGTTYTITMPTGSALDTAIGSIGTDMAFDFTIVNTASGTITLAVNTGITVVGSLSIPTGTSATYKIRKTNINIFIMYRK